MVVIRKINHVTVVVKRIIYLSNVILKRQFATSAIRKGTFQRSANLCNRKEILRMSSVNPRKETQWVQADGTSDSETNLPVLRVNSKSSYPIRIELKVNNKLL